MSNTNAQPALMSQTSSEGDGSGMVPFECYGRNGDFQMAANFIDKLQALRYLLEADLLACDAKWTLFVAAALSYRYDTQLKPFPPRFVSEQTGFNIDALVSVINDTPKLRVVLQHIVEENYEEFDAEVMDLLHHVLVVLREPTLRLVDEDEFESLLRSMGQSDDVPRPTHVFEVTRPVAVSQEAVIAEEPDEPQSDSLPPPPPLSSFADQPLKLAFYGNKLDSFFSMLARGANRPPPSSYNDNNNANINSNNNNNNSSGEQTTLLLTTDLLASLEHSPNGAGWGASACGSMISCVALCEFDNNPEFVNCKMSESGAPAAGIEVRNRDLVRVRYLLFYGSRFPDEGRVHDRHMFGWIGRHKYSLSLACYMLLLASIGVANSGSGQYWKHLVSKKALMVLDFCKRIFTTD